MPSVAEANGLAVDDVLGDRNGTASRIDWIAPEPRVDAELVGSGVVQLHGKRGVHRKIRVDVVAVDAIQPAGLQWTRGDVFDELR